jgi:outer membrane protein assembly factor BamE
MVLFFLSMSGCASKMGDHFDQVKVGMEKHDVLMLMDSPQRTQRWQGKDRWTYIFYEDNSRIEKEVHFKEGIANYVGDTYKPPVTAEEQDAINEKANRDLEAREVNRQAELRSAYSDYEIRSKAQDGIRYVPQFKPVE